MVENDEVNNSMEIPSIRSVLKNTGRRNAESPPLIPQEAFCPTCHKIYPAWPGLPEALVLRGLTLVDAEPAICICIRQAAERLADRLRDANLAEIHPRTLESFIARPGTENALAAADAFIGGHGPAVLTLVGGTGSGKSHLLEAVGRILIQDGRFCRFEEAAALLQNMRPPADGDRQERDWFYYYIGVPVLLIDDLGVEKPTVWAIERLTAILSPRIRDQRRTMITTNYTQPRMKQHLAIADSVGAQRLVSRLYGAASGEAIAVTLTCSDYRAGRT